MLTASPLKVYTNFCYSVFHKLNQFEWNFRKKHQQITVGKMNNEENKEKNNIKFL